MGILSSKFILRKCQCCQQEQQHYVQGFYTAPACVACMKTLPPVPQGMRRCPRCLDFFQATSIYQSWCVKCRSTYSKQRYNAEATRDQNLRTNYGISLEEYTLMLFQQGGVCAICNCPETVIDPYTKKTKALAVDHNHETGHVRQLLCSTCNHMVGWLEKDRKRVKLALKYLKKHDM